MSDNSKIEWTDATWNPVRGCSKVSPGCLHCYAETFAERFRGVPGHPFEFGFDLRLVPEDLGKLDLRGINWIIVGGESGPRARPIEAPWVRGVHAECLAHNIPFFFKQWGGVRKASAGRKLDGRTYDEFPEIVSNAVLPSS